MINDELLNYIKSEIAKGKPLQEIKSTLLNNGGWTPSDLEEAFSVINSSAKIIKDLERLPKEKNNLLNNNIFWIIIITTIIILFILGYGARNYFQAMTMNYKDSGVENYTKQHQMEEKSSLNNSNTIGKYISKS